MCAVLIPVPSLMIFSYCTYLGCMIFIGGKSSFIVNTLYKTMVEGSFTECRYRNSVNVIILLLILFVQDYCLF